MAANPVDVHRATDAILTVLHQLAQDNMQLLFVATALRARQHRCQWFVSAGPCG